MICKKILCIKYCDFCFSDLYLEWLLAIALIGGIAAPLNYRWVSLIIINLISFTLRLRKHSQLVLFSAELWRGKIGNVGCEASYASYWRELSMPVVFELPKRWHTFAEVACFFEFPLLRFHSINYWNAQEAFCEFSTLELLLGKWGCCYYMLHFRYKFNFLFLSCWSL